ncbi:VTT domain-containing protein [Halobacterium jilantaiense]|uniref:SNARE associated Golgi protein n=1 Tax=Halobacterium jilantaiense TaxID=355548 RepID=A0A1I0NWQ0_9EURY|nr:VTT domain-containing protein [Halobacterium jilantaiense]SEW06250.1 SNARE associated Golgi protein [Halobacterium jilantaiense]
MSVTAPLLLGLDFGGVESAVRAATGWTGLALIFVYSFLITFVLPLPGEVVLCPAGYVCGEAAHLGLGLSGAPLVLVVMLVSAAGKALGSVVALHLGYNASHSGIVVRTLRRFGYDPVEWSRSKLVNLVKRYGYYGMAMALSVPFFPDTISVYAFSVIDKDYERFAAAAFAGGVGRLVVTIALFEGVIILA